MLTVLNPEIFNNFAHCSIRKSILVELRGLDSSTASGLGDHGSTAAPHDGSRKLGRSRETLYAQRGGIFAARVGFEKNMSGGAICVAAI
jgi:hypothetical protein